MEATMATASTTAEALTISVPAAPTSSSTSDPRFSAGGTHHNVLSATADSDSQIRISFMWVIERMSSFGKLSVTSGRSRATMIFVNDYAGKS